MKPLAILLLVGVFIRHGSAGWLADLTSFPVKGIFYILGGMWEAILCVALLRFIILERETLWVRLAMLACVAGAIEGLQMAVCRTLTPDISAVPVGENLCWQFTNPVPVGIVLYVCYFFAAMWIIGGRGAGANSNPLP